VSVVGASTALLAATMGLVQNDIKKVLAYSTVSQLGYMFLAMGVAAFGAGIFHLTTHAFFKALLFLGSGAVIHAMHDEQDIQKMGGLKKYMPTTYWTFLVGAIALSGIPPLSGFFSKDEILWRAFSSEYGSPALWLVGAVAALCTAFYMFRLVSLTFESGERFDHHRVHPHEAPRTMTIPLIVLAILSVTGGFVGIPESLLGGNAIEHWLDPVFERAHATLRLAHHAASVAEYVLMALSVSVAVAGIAGARHVYLRRTELAEQYRKKFPRIHGLLFNKYYVDEVYDASVVKPIVGMSDRMLWKVFDVSIIDGAVNGTARLVGVVAQRIKQIQTGLAQSYATFFIAGILLILTWLMAR
ncbi:MAG: NADH-quinone oxidoreductase subunit L, partial [Ignavibacteriales bacterium]|nr:NADH-quinone oxidoreductase subunit L [Ignavibacteriales bacterium]